MSKSNVTQRGNAGASVAPFTGPRVSKTNDDLEALALDWYGRAMEVLGNRDEAHRDALAATYEGFIKERGLDLETREQLSAFLSAGVFATCGEVAA